MDALHHVYKALETARDAINALIPYEMKRLAGESCASQDCDDGTWEYYLPCRENSVSCKISWAFLPGRYEAIFYNPAEKTLGDEITHASSLREIVAYIRTMNRDGTVPPPGAGKRTRCE